MHTTDVGFYKGADDLNSGAHVLHGALYPWRVISPDLQLRFWKEREA